MTAPLNLSLQQAKPWLTQAHVVGDERTVFQRVHTDSRSVQPGDLFVALQGERFDAHDFLASLQSQGVHAALAQRVWPKPGSVAFKCPTVDRPWASWLVGGANNSNCLWWR